MFDISKYASNAQKYLRLSWAAWEAGSKGDNEGFERILNERSKLQANNFTLEDYDSMIEDSKSYPPECNMWKRAKEEYIAEHQQEEIKKVKKGSTKTSTKYLRKNA